MKTVRSWPSWARNSLYIGLTLAALYAVFRWLLPLILPFALALGLARLMEPFVRFLKERWKIPRRLGAALLTVLLFGALLAGLFFLLARLFREINELIERAPAFIARLPEVSESLTERLERWIAAAPPSLRDTLRRASEGVLNGVGAIPAALIGNLTNWVSGFAAALPKMLLFVCAVVLSTFLISADYIRVTGAILKPFPSKLREKILSVKSQVANTLGKWLKAQGLMTLITFCELFAGLLLLRVPAALLPALLIAFIDALPVLGSGICLLPWAAVSLASGDTARAAGLAALYAIIVLVRGMTEPKLVGSQIGLGALPTFMAMYIGFVSAGVFGIIAFPILLITIRQVWNNSITA